MLTTSHSLARCVAKAVVFQPLAAVVDNVLGFLVDGGVDVDVNGNVSWGFNLCVSNDGFIDGLLFALRKANTLDCRGFGAVESSDLSFTAIALTILAVSNKVAFLTITWRFGRGRYRAYITNWNFTSNECNVTWSLFVHTLCSPSLSKKNCVCWNYMSLSVLIHT